MDLRKLKTLIDLVSDSNVSELEITEAEGKIRIVKPYPSPAPHAQTVYMHAPAPMPAAIVWTRADVLLNGDLQSFIEAVTTFDSAAVERELAAEDDEPVQVEFFVLVGEPRRS